MLSRLIYVSLFAVGAVSADVLYIGKCIVPWVMIIFRTSRVGSVYFTMAVTVERYVVVHWPLEAKDICSRKRIRIAIVVIIIWAIFSIIPDYFKVSMVLFLDFIIIALAITLLHM